MPRYLLDTDTCIHVLRGKSGVVERLAELNPDDVAISIITVFELYAGAGKSRHPEKEQKKVDLFLEPVTVLEFSRKAAQEAVRLRVDLEKAGNKIGPYDLLIAAQALASKLTLATGNVREFERVPGLLLEEWR